MATVVNFIDTTLQSAPTRTVNLPTAKVLVTPSAPVFHVATDGTITPASITFAVTLIDIEGAVSITCPGGTLSSVTNSSATLRAVDLSASSALVTASVTVAGATFSGSCFISKVQDGAGGSTTYTWIKYADSAAGAGLSDDPTGKAYIGLAYNKSSATESTVASDYTWSLIKGADGQPGLKGADGAQLYTWIKYSDYADGTGLYDIPTANTVYIGIAVNKATATESTVKTDYVWSKFKGDQGVPGTGQRGPGWFYWSGSSWSDAAADAATPGDTQVDDQVTISNGTVSYTKRWNGSAWVVPGAYMDGNLFVEKSITAAKINANGLEIRDPQGNLILGAGSALPVAYAAPGTLNSDLTPAIAAAMSNGQNIYPPIDDASWGGGTVATVTDGKVGSKVRRSIGDTVTYHPTLTPIDRTRSYRVRFWARAAAGTNGVLYHDLRQYVGADPTGLSNGGRSPYLPANIPAHTDWREYDYIWDNTRWQAATTHVAPDFLLNYEGTAGYWEVQGYSVVDATDAVRAQAAADAKLSKSAADNLAAIITLQTGGAILAGDTTNGSYHNKDGFFGVQGGVVKFGVPISGDPYFAGRLTAAYGTFGAVVIGSTCSFGQTAYDTGTGGWIQGGATPKMSLKAANGASFLCDPANNILSMNGATLSSPNMSSPVVSNPVTASITSTVGSQYANGTTAYGALTAHPSGGSGAVTCTWSLVNNGVLQLKLSAYSGTSVSVIKGNGTASNTDAGANVSLTVTDASGFSIVTMISVFFTIGVPP